MKNAPKIHSTALCETRYIGAETRIWAYTHILKGAKIGQNCNICDFVFIEDDVTIGNNVTIKSGVQLWNSLYIEDDVFIGPNVTFTNDKFPRSKRYLKQHPKTFVKKGASIGANATILPGIIINQNAMVGAGSVVTRNVPPHAIIAGNPARIINYIDTPTEEPTNTIHSYTSTLLLNKCRLIPIQSFRDLRGEVSVLEISKFIPFIPKRIFNIHSVPNKFIRGEHAHKKCHQILLILSGECKVIIDDGSNRKAITLTENKFCLSVTPMTWTTQYAFSQNAILLVLASHTYDENDYIRDYQAYLELKNLT